MNLGWKTEESESNHLENESSMIEKYTALYSQRGKFICDFRKKNSGEIHLNQYFFNDCLYLSAQILFLLINFQQ